jgi:hypothetical protein
MQADARNVILSGMSGRTIFEKISDDNLTLFRKTIQFGYLDVTVYEKLRSGLARSIHES